MSTINLLTGLFFIILGFLVRKFPYLIAGYNNTSVPEKRDVDEKVLTAFIQNLLFSLGLLNIGFFFIAGLVSWPESYGVSFFKYTTIGFVTFTVLYLNLKKPHHKK